MLAEQVAEKERKKKEEEARRKQEEERDNERIRREQAAEEARLEARRQEDEAKKRALVEENERAAVARQGQEEEDEPPGPLPPRKPMARRSMRGTEDQGFASDRGTRSDLFGLPQAQPAQPAPVHAHHSAFNTSPSSSPLPWEMGGAVGAMPASFRAAPGPAGTAGAAGAPPVNDMLQGLMHQQQELYRHQQDALARLQEEADRLRQEKECARQDLLDMKARQLEEKEKDVKKLQRKLQRQMLLQSSNAPGQAPLHSMLPSVSSTPVEGRSGMGGPAGELWGGFYSKYEAVDSSADGPSGESDASRWEPGYPTDDELSQLRQDPHTRMTSAIPSDPHAWPVAPVPWLQPAEAEAANLDFPHISAEAPEPCAGEASLFEDSWGKPLENTAQLDERLGNTAVSGIGNLGNEATQMLEGTLVGDSKFVQANTLGATWIGAEREEERLKASASLSKNLAISAHLTMQPTTEPAEPAGPTVAEDSPRASEPHDAHDALTGSGGFAEFADYFPPQDSKLSEGEDPSDPLSLLQGAVNAIREVRAEVTQANTSSSFAGAGPSDAPFSAREGDEAPSESWEGVLRQFGADQADLKDSKGSDKGSDKGDSRDKSLKGLVISKPGRPPRRARHKEPDLDAGHPGGYPMEEMPEMSPDLLMSGSGQPDSLDFLQGLGLADLAASTMGTTSLDGLGTQRPIAKDDFAAFAAATPEDFDAFLSRLRSQPSPSQEKPEGKDSARGRQPVAGSAGVSAKDRAKFGSPTLRAAAGSLLQDRPASGQSQISGVSAISAGRPGSGGSAGSLNSGVALRDLRNQRRKPRTTEDYLSHDLPVGAALPDAGPGTSLHATLPVSVPREPSALQALREERRKKERGVGD